MSFATSIPRGALALLVAGAALGAWAQAEDTEAAKRTLGPPVLSDSGALPPEDRDSAGAVLLDRSPVRAQREEQRMQRNVDRALARERARTDGERSREAAPGSTREMGAGGQTTP